MHLFGEVNRPAFISRSIRCPTVSPIADGDAGGEEPFPPDTWATPTPDALPPYPPVNASPFPLTTADSVSEPRLALV